MIKSKTTFALALWSIACSSASAITTAENSRIAHLSSVTATSVQQTTWDGIPAIRTSHGQIEAIIVPAWGRVMRFGYIGGKNILWVAPPESLKAPGFKNRGGSKLWPAPQSEWTNFTGDVYPPDPSWDGQAFKSDIIAPNSKAPTIRLTSGKWSGVGVRAVIEFSWDSDGAFVIHETFHKISGGPRRISLWNVAQVNYPDRVYAMTGAKTALKNGYFWFFGGPSPQYEGSVTHIAENCIKIVPDSEYSYKIGLDTANPTLVSISDGTAFTMSAKYINLALSPYPDGPDGDGFPVEFYNQGGGAIRYNEEELLSPLYTLHQGQSCSQTIRWTLSPISSDSDTSQQTVLNLLTPAAH